MMYKVLNNLIDIPTHYFVPNHLSLKNGYFTQLPTRVNYFKLSFFPSVATVIKIWNSYFTSFCNQLLNP